jgi:hypothetical protein
MKTITSKNYRRLFSLLIALALFVSTMSVVIIAEEPSGTLTYLLTDFEDGNKRFVDTAGCTASIVVPPNSLVGSKSLKLDILGQNVGITASNLSANMDAYDGVVIRIKSGGPADVLYFVTNLNGQNIAAENIKLVYMNGTITGTGMTGTSFTLKSDFDGYVFYPFGDLKAAIKAGGGGGFNSVQFGFYSATAGTSISADQISLYTGAQADYLKVIEEIDPGAIIEPIETQTHLLTGFEDGNKRFVDDPGCTASIVESPNNLVGNKSLKLDILGQNVGITASGLSADMDAYDGVVIRIKSAGPKDVTYFLANLNGQTIDATNIKIVDMEANIISTGTTGTSFNLKSDFDGYVFYPFGDLKAAIKAAGGGGFNSVQFGFYSATAGTSVYIDQIALYKGAEDNYLKVIKEIDPDGGNILTPNNISVANPDPIAQVLFDFENGNDPFENQITIYNRAIPEATAPEIVSGTSGLIGNNSLKINMVKPVDTYDGIKLTTKKYVKYHGYSGIAVRIKTDSRTLYNAFSIILSGIDANGLEYNGTIGSRWLYINKNGVARNAFATINGWYCLPSDFDGYAFFSFDSYISSKNPVYRPLPIQSECDRIKSAKTYNVGIIAQIPYVSADGKDRYDKWLPYSYIIDQIAFYSASDNNGYQAVIDKLEPESSIVVKTMEERYAMKLSVKPIVFESPYTGPAPDYLNTSPLPTKEPTKSESDTSDIASSNTSSGNSSSDASSNSSSNDSEDNNLTLDSLKNIIQKTTGNTIFIKISKFITLTPQMLQAVAESGKMLIITLVDSNDKSQIIWKFEKVAKTDIEFDLSLISNSPNESVIKTLTSTGQIFSMIQSGQLPDKIKITVLNQKFQNGDKLELFKFNSQTGKLEQTKIKVAMNSDATQLQFVVDNGAEYVIDKIVNSDKVINKVEPEEKQTNWLLISLISCGAILIGLAIYLLVFTRQKKRLLNLKIVSGSLD